MGTVRRGLGLLLATGILMVACGDEDPTSVGGVLLPGGAIRTFEVVLDAERFLLEDTTVTGFTKPAQVAFLIVASAYQDELEARALGRFAQPPATITFRDAGGTTRTDSMPRFFGGQVVVRVDTLRSAGTPPVKLALYKVAEPWHAGSATWMLRVDSGGVQLPWLEPGGTRGALVDTASWTAAGDSLFFDVDSATVAEWADTTNAARGALLVAETPGARLRLLAGTLLLRLNARPAARPDTVVTATTVAVASTFVYDPPAPALAAAVQMGGTPAWRSFLRFRERLDTLRLAQICIPEDALLCERRLGDATINFASLVLAPVTVPAAFLPEDSMLIDARTVFPAPLVPLVRAPLGEVVGRARAPIAPSAFDGAGGEPVEIAVTGFVAALARSPAPDTADTMAAAAPNRLALLGLPERGLFGFGAFGSRARADRRPKLRVIVTFSTEAGL